MKDVLQFLAEYFYILFIMLCVIVYFIVVAIENAQKKHYFVTNIKNIPSEYKVNSMSDPTKTYRICYATRNVKPKKANKNTKIIEEKYVFELCPLNDWLVYHDGDVVVKAAKIAMKKINGQIKYFATTIHIYGVYDPTELDDCAEIKKYLR